ncbi:hypothetical protein CLUP02_01840 [Colletotrichum lupini]|uniref:Uncharacterized protein n=1 Tax=Colletotrichum lupini TaxID=145971 RepID=A0A9Q8WA32_9PEZI|nr:hypothetical protein CLUP02_01840 [Colletotrichum lupini]
MAQTIQQILVHPTQNARDEKPPACY